MTDTDAKRSPRRKQPPPPHLSEFYSFVDGSSPISPSTDSNPQIVSTSSPTKGKLQTHLPVNLPSSASSTLSQANSSYLQSQSQSQSQSRSYSHSNVYSSRPHSIRSIKKDIIIQVINLIIQNIKQNNRLHIIFNHRYKIYKTRQLSIQIIFNMLIYRIFYLVKFTSIFVYIFSSFSSFLYLIII